MGYQNHELAARYRPQFPVTQNLIYLNHAAVAPLAKPAADAMANLADDACRFGSLHYDTWLDAYEGLRVSSATLIGAHRSEIAIVKNTSEGIAAIANGIAWKPGDKIICFREEFPANFFPWIRLAEKGLNVVQLSIDDPLDRIDRECQGARLLAISFVNYFSGRRMDLDALGEICRRRGCFFFVDAIQGMGAFPIDVNRSHISALAADGHKWMFGPEGCGVLYVRKDLQDAIEPAEFGWTNVARFADYASRDMTLRPDAGRYECGTLNTISCFGLRAAIDFTLQVGVDRIAEALHALAARVTAGVEAKGYQVVTPRTDATGSGIVTFRKQGIDSGMLVRTLRENKIIAAPRQGCIRTSPHFYITEEEIDRMVDLLP